VISRILFQISSDKHQRSYSRRVEFQNCYSLLVSEKVRLWLLTFRVHLHLNSKLSLSRSWFVNLKNIWIGVHTSWYGGVGARNGCLAIAFKLSTFTSSFLRARTRNVYRFKTFELFIACRDFRTFLFENVWVNRGIKGYFKRKATFEQAAELSGLQIRIECHKLSSGKCSFSRYCSEFKFWDRFAKVRFELAKTAMHSQRSWWMFN